MFYIKTVPKEEQDEKYRVEKDSNINTIRYWSQNGLGWLLYSMFLRLYIYITYLYV